MNTSASGWKTSEFWAHVVVQVGTLWSAVHGFIPAKYEAIIAVVGTAVYTICRTAYKAYTDIKASSAPATQVDAQTVVVNK